MGKELNINMIAVIVVSASLILCCVTPTVLVVIWIQREVPAIRCNYQISIIGDEGLANNKYITGSGTVDDPYVLENLELNTDKKCCILVENTSKYLIIRNCFLESRTSIVTIKNSVNATITIYKNKFVCDFTTFYPLVGVYSSPGIKITNNELISYREGLLVNNCSFATIASNSFQCEEADYCIKFDRYTTNCIISSNFFKIITEIDCCLDLYGNSNFTIEDNSFVYLMYYSYDDAIYCNDCENFTINKNKFIGNFNTAIVIEESNNFIISDNIIQNSAQGIYYGFSSNAIINRNNISNNYFVGLTLDHSNYLNITSNEFKNHTRDAIQIYDSGNCSFIFQNNFIGNNVDGSSTGDQQAYDECGNTWYNPNTHLGNYWDDLVWYEGCTYEIDGNMTSDLYPLQNPVDI